MASGGDIIDQINATIIEAVTEGFKNETTKPKASPEGMLVAYTSLIIMAVLPIFFGSFHSISFQKENSESGERVEPMSRSEAALFPIYASGALFLLYIIFKFFSKEHVNLLLSIYFLALGTISLSSVVSRMLNNFVVRFTPGLLRYNREYHLLFKSNEEEIINLRFETKDVVSFILCTAIGIWYVFKKHWLANNLFGFSFAIKAIEYINLNSIATGCILLSGLFIYDIFWVFGTDVMVTVAKSFDAPIKLVFPQDFLVNGIHGTQYAMLGLGDIVIPGIFIALLLRFDVSLGRGKHTYFYTSFIAYIVGLLITMGVMFYFKHAQPALLYLVPCCILFPFFVALFKGELMTLVRFEDEVKDEVKDEDKSSEEVVPKAEKKKVK